MNPPPNPHRKLLAALTLVSGFLYAAPALSGPSNVPFSATVTTFEVLQPNADASCPLAGMTIGTGTASPLGRTLIVATDCATPTATGFHFASGRLVFTAANGDTLSASYTGTFLTTVPGTVLTMNNGVYVITGGTGQFAGAFGRGELHGTEDIGTKPAQGHLDATGIISLPAWGGLR